MSQKQQKVKGINYVPLTYTRYPYAHIARNGCASYTTDPGVANGWVGSGGTVLRVVVPRTAAISIPAFGINIHSEHECVISGTAWAAWDAWQYKAPTFEEVPLDTNHMIERMRNPYYPKVDKREMPKLFKKDKNGQLGDYDSSREYWNKYASQGQANKVVTATQSKSFTSTIGVGKDHDKSVEYKVGEIVKGHLSGNLCKIDKVDDDGVVHLIVQKTGPYGSSPPGTENKASIHGFGQSL